MLQLKGNASSRVEIQFSPTDYVKAQYLVPVSKVGGCCPLGALLREKGQQPRVPRHRPLFPEQDTKGFSLHGP